MNYYFFEVLEQKTTKTLNMQQNSIHHANSAIIWVGKLII